MLKRLPIASAQVKAGNKSKTKWSLPNQIFTKTPTIISSLCDYSDAHIYVKGTITIPSMEAAGGAANNANNIWK